jgi:hypothetical protein
MVEKLHQAPYLKVGRYMEGSGRFWKVPSSLGPSPCLKCSRAPGNDAGCDPMCERPEAPEKGPPYYGLLVFLQTHPINPLLDKEFLFLFLRESLNTCLPKLPPLVFQIWNVMTLACLLSLWFPEPSRLESQCGFCKALAESLPLTLERESREFPLENNLGGFAVGFSQTIQGFCIQG